MGYYKINQKAVNNYKVPKNGTVFSTCAFVFTIKYFVGILFDTVASFITMWHFVLVCHIIFL